MICLAPYLKRPVSAMAAAGVLLSLSCAVSHAASVTDDAGDPKIWISAVVASHHVDPLMDYNERNRGVGIEYHQTGDLLYMVGSYRNSVFRQSVYGLVGWTPLHVGPLSLGAVAGVINGYPELNNGRVGPIASALIRLEGKGAFRNFGANLIIAPPVPQKKSPMTLGLQIKFGF